MAFDYQETFSRIIVKANMLVERYRMLEAAKAETDRQLAELREEVKDKDKELEQLRNELYYLRMATTISPSREQVEATRAVINNLVRDIDRCIEDLSD